MERCEVCGANLALVGRTHLCRPPVVATANLDEALARAAERRPRSHAGLGKEDLAQAQRAVNAQARAAVEAVAKEPPVRVSEQRYLYGRDIVKRRAYMREYMRKRRAK